jgi:hypothetical protein
MKFFVWGIISGIMAMSFEAWAPTIEGSAPSHFARIAKVAQVQP